MQTVLDLFSGIGGFSLGLSWAGGFRTVAFCECEPFCQKVLRKHWPDTPIYDDIRTLTYERLRADGIGPIDVITGGFPCQPFSQAGKRGGTSDDRHLWPEMARVISAVRPSWVIAENVPGIINMELDTVLTYLEIENYACQTLIIPACGVDAPHRRDRVWIVAYADSGRQSRQGVCEEQPWRSEVIRGSEVWAGRAMADTNGQRRQQKPRSAHGDEGEDEGRTQAETHEPSRGREEGTSSDVSDTSPMQRYPFQRYEPNGDVPGDVSRANQRSRLHGATQASGANREPQVAAGGCNCAREQPAIWEPEPCVGRVATGVPNRVDRLRALGNAVVPQIPMILGRFILEAEDENRRGR